MHIIVIMEVRYLQWFVLLSSVTLVADATQGEEIETSWIPDHGNEVNEPGDAVEKPWLDDADLDMASDLDSEAGYFDPIDLYDSGSGDAASSFNWTMSKDTRTEDGDLYTEDVASKESNPQSQGDFRNENCTPTNPPKSCPPGLPCVNGECKDDDLSSDEQIFYCICSSGWIGVLCDKCCDLDCGANGNCDLINDTMICGCEWGYEGEYCENISPHYKYIPQPKPYYIVIICSVITILMAVIVLLYGVWRRRKKYLPLMKVAYLLQGYENEGEYAYDAFVSYCCEPETNRWVMEELLPQMKSRGNFRFCVHYINFIPGDTIVNNIINAVESSRRMILVLTPNYIQSEWAQFEYEVAHRRMILHKIKFIPIILKDISKVSNIQKGLRHILDTITFIKWPENENSKKLFEFWDRLRLSMPKKRNTSSAMITQDGLPDYSRYISSFPEKSDSSANSTPKSERKGHQRSQQSSTWSLSSFKRDSTGSTRYINGRVEQGFIENGGKNTLVTSQNIKNDVPPTSPLTCDNGKQDNNCETVSADLAGSSMNLLGSGTGVPGKPNIKLRIPQVIIDGSSTPPADITCCGLAQSTV